MAPDPQNRMLLSGRIATVPEWDHAMFGEDFFRCMLSIARLSGAADRVPLLFSGRLCDPAVMKVDQHARVQGQVRAYKKVVAGRNRLLIVAFARQLSPESEALEPLNSVELTGHLLRPAVHRMTPLGREIADMLVGIPRAGTKVDCLPCIAWGRNARYAASLPTGALITCQGRLQSRAYQKKLEDESVEERTALEISLVTIAETREAP